MAAALAQETPILLLDEPAAFLDYRRQLELADLLEGIRLEGGGSGGPCTIVSVVHDLNGGALEGDLVIALSGGRIAFTGSPAELVEDGRLADIYGVGFEAIRHQGTGRTLLVPVTLHGSARPAGGDRA